MKWWNSHSLAKSAVTLMCFASLLVPKMLTDDLEVQREERVEPIVNCLKNEECKEAIRWRDFINITSIPTILIFNIQITRS